MPSYTSCCFFVAYLFIVGLVFASLSGESMSAGRPQVLTGPVAVLQQACFLPPSVPFHLRWIDGRRTLAKTWSLRLLAADGSAVAARLRRPLPRHLDRPGARARHVHADRQRGACGSSALRQLRWALQTANGNSCTTGWQARGRVVRTVTFRRSLYWNQPQPASSNIDFSFLTTRPISDGILQKMLAGNVPRAKFGSVGFVVNNPAFARSLSGRVAPPAPCANGSPLTR